MELNTSKGSVDRNSSYHFQASNKVWNRTMTTGTPGSPGVAAHRWRAPACPSSGWASAFLSQDDAGDWISGAQPGRSRVSQATFQGQQLPCVLLLGLSSPGLAEASMVIALRFQAPLDLGWHSRPLAPYALGRGGVTSPPEAALKPATRLIHARPLSGPVLLQPIPITLLALRAPSPWVWSFRA